MGGFKYTQNQIEGLSIIPINLSVVVWHGITILGQQIPRIFSPGNKQRIIRYANYRISVVRGLEQWTTPEIRIIK